MLLLGPAGTPAAGTLFDLLINGLFYPTGPSAPAASGRGVGNVQVPVSSAYVARRIQLFIVHAFAIAPGALLHRHYGFPSD